MESDFSFDPNIFIWDFETVTNWDERIQHYTPVQKNYFKYMIPKFGQMKDLAEDVQDWTVLTNDRKKKILIESKKNNDSQLLIMRAQGPMDFPAMDVFRTIVKLDMTSDWDSGKDETKFVKKFGVNSYGMYTRTKAVMVVSGRDFVLNFMFNKEQDGTIIILCLDTNDKEIIEQFPPRKGVTRGGLPISGWIIKPD